MIPRHCPIKLPGIPPVKAGVPPFWQQEISSVLADEDAIRQRVAEIGERIESDFLGKELVVVALLTGTVPFLADLIRNIAIPMRLDFIGVSSYGDGTTSGELSYTKDLKLDVRNHHVLLVDDILDTGNTLDSVIKKITELSPASLDVCVLLNKQAHREKDVEAQYVGFEIPDEFVVGYGLDYAEQYRNLPFVGVLRLETYH